MKRFALLTTILAALCISIATAEPVEDFKPGMYGSGYSGKGYGTRMEPHPERRIIPRILNAVPPYAHDRPDEFLADLQIGQAADYSEPGRLVIISSTEETHVVPYRVSKIAPDFIELTAEGSTLRLRGSAITSIHTYKSPDDLKVQGKKAAE